MFVPIVYLFYPETSDRTLEDIDRLFRENGSVFIFKDKDAISAKRPERYFEMEEGWGSGRDSSDGNALRMKKTKDVEFGDNSGVVVDHEEGYGPTK